MYASTKPVSDQLSNCIRGHFSWRVQENIFHGGFKRTFFMMGSIGKHRFFKNSDYSLLILSCHCKSVIISLFRNLRLHQLRFPLITWWIIRRMVSDNWIISLLNHPCKMVDNPSSHSKPSNHTARQSINIQDVNQNQRSHR